MLAVKSVLKYLIKFGGFCLWLKYAKDHLDVKYLVKLIFEWQTPYIKPS